MSDEARNESKVATTMASFFASFALLTLLLLTLLFFEHKFTSNSPPTLQYKDLRSALALVIFDCSVTGELLHNFLVNFWDFSILKPKIHLNLQVSKIKFLESSEGGRLDFGS